jgi:hypothetical protein
VVRIEVEPMAGPRDRLTAAFRMILAIPHILLVGGPMAVAWSWSSNHGDGIGWTMGGGLLGIAAPIIAIVAWLVILITGRYPRSLWNFAVFYLRWRVRAIAYMMLLRDEYPPFGEGDYPAAMSVTFPEEPRNRLTVAFRCLLVLPHAIAIWLLGIAWIFSTIIAWFSILFTGEYPEALYAFSVGVLRWNTRVEAYMLLLRDEYPPFTLRVNP